MSDEANKPNEGTQESGEGTNPETYTIKVDGKEETLTTEQLIERAQKGTAAEKRMQEADQIKKEAAGNAAVVDAMRRLEQEQWNETDFRLIASAAGMPIDRQNEVVADYHAAAQRAQNAGNQQPPTTQHKETPVGYQNLDPTMQRVQSEVYWDLVDRKTQDVIANDEVLSKLTGDKAEKVQALVREKVRTRSGNSTVRPEVITRSVEEVRGLVNDLGTNQDGSLPPGVGKAPSVDRKIGNTEPPKRVSMGDAGWDENFVERLQHAARELEDK